MNPTRPCNEISSPDFVSPIPKPSLYKRPRFPMSSAAVTRATAATHHGHGHSTARAKPSLYDTPRRPLAPVPVAHTQVVHTPRSDGVTGHSRKGAISSHKGVAKPSLNLRPRTPLNSSTMGNTVIQPSTAVRRHHWSVRSGLPPTPPSSPNQRNVSHSLRSEASTTASYPTPRTASSTTGRALPAATVHPPPAKSLYAAVLREMSPSEFLAEAIAMRLDEAHMSATYPVDAVEPEELPMWY
jgi:hypothetical protein